MWLGTLCLFPDLVSGCGLRDWEAQSSVCRNHTKYLQHVSEVGGWAGSEGEAKGSGQMADTHTNVMKEPDIGSTDVL